MLCQMLKIQSLSVSYQHEDVVTFFGQTDGTKLHFVSRVATNWRYEDPREEPDVLPHVSRKLLKLEFHDYNITNVLYKGPPANPQKFKEYIRNVIQVLKDHDL